MKKKYAVIAAAAVVAIAAGAAAYLLARPHLFPPKVVGKLSIVAYSPQGAEVPISADGIAIMFNKAVVPLSSLDRGRQRALPLEISPALPGKFFWLGTHGFVFRPSEPLAPATTYRVTLSPGVISVDGFRLDEQLSWEFSTVRPRVITMEPGDGETLLPRDGSLFYRFNIAMDPADVERKIRIANESTGSELAVARDYVWGDDDHTLRVKFEGELPWSAKIAVTLPRGLRAKAGAIGTADDVAVTYRTPDRVVRVEKVTAVDMDVHGEDGPVEVDLKPGKKQMLSAGSGICYLFTQPITKKSFERAFRVERSKDDAAAASGNKKNPQAFFYFADYEGYQLAGRSGEEGRVEGYRRGCASFLEDYARSYSFALDPGKVESLSGASLEGGGDAFSVSTGNAEPSLKSLLTKNIISAGGAMRIPYRAINVSDINVRLYRVADPWSYDENIKSDVVWEQDLKGGDVVSQAIGASGFKVPINRATMVIDQAAMPADAEMLVPVNFRENASTRFLVDLADLPSKPEPGIWLVEAVPVPSVEGAGQAGPRAVYSMIQVSSVGLAVKRETSHVLAWATDIESGAPIDGLSVKANFAKWNSAKGALEKKLEAESRTNSQGVALMANPAGEEMKVCAEASGPGRFAWSCETDHNLTGYRDTLRPGRDFYAWVYTDRPIYRPGQKVYFSSFVRRVEEGRYFALDSKEVVSVLAQDSQGNEIFADAGAAVAEGGVVSGEFALPDGDGAPRGTYTLVVGVGKQKFTKAFVVTSYRKPSFKVDISPDAPEIVSGDELKAKVVGTYFFGSPMRKAVASWSIMTSTFVFAPDGFSEYSFIDDDLLRRRQGGEGEAEYESDFEYDILASAGFGGDVYAEDASQYDDPRNAGGAPSGYGSSFFSGGKGDDSRFVPAKLGENGELLIDYKPDLKKYPTSQLLSVEAAVTDPSLQQVSASGDVIVHKGAFYLGLKPVKWVWAETEKAEVDVVALDTKGKPAGGQGFAVEVVRREYKFIERRNAAGYWDFVFTPQDTKLATLTAKSDGSGKAKVEFKLPQGGEYRFVAKGKDGRGNEVQSAVAVYAWGRGYVPWRMDKPEELELVPDKDAYRVGETAKILVKSLLPATRALVTYERGRILQYKVAELGGNASHIEIPIESGMIPNFYLSVVAHAGRDGDRPPLLFYGETAINVEPESKRLSVFVEADRAGAEGGLPVYRPGEEVTVKVKTTDPEGRPVPAHVMATVADESVFRLLNYRLPDLVKKFYYRRPSGVVTSSSMLSLKAGDAGKGGKKRRIFKDTAHFVANLSTDAKGEAIFSFVLPDDLTTWVIEALGSTEPISFEKFNEQRKAALAKTPAGQAAVGANLALSDGSFVGGSRAKITSTLPVVLRTALPRFAAWGDKIIGKVIAMNRNPGAIDGKLAVSVTGSATLSGGKAAEDMTLALAGGEEKTYPVTIDVAEAGDQFALSAAAADKAGEALDSLEITVPMKDRFSPEVVATSGMTTGAEQEQIDVPDDITKALGGMSVRLRASLALAAAPSLKALIDFPFGCSEQKSASLAALLFARDMTERLGEGYFDSLAPVAPDVAAGLKDLEAKKAYLGDKIEALITELIEKFQNYDGGLRYWPESSSASYFATVQALWAMTMAKAQGFAVNDAAMTKMRAFIRGQIVPPAKNAVVKDVRSWDEKAYGLWALSRSGPLEAGVGDNFAGHEGEMSISGLSYLLMAMTQQGQVAGAARLAGAILAQAKQEPRHTSWPASKFFWSSAVKNTALASMALLTGDPDDATVPRALAFLLNRKKAAPCTCTQDNLYVSWLVTEFAKIHKEGEADFKAAVMADKTKLAEGAFDKKNLLTEIVRDLPMQDIAKLDMPADVTVEKRGDGTLYYDMVLKYYLPPKDTPTREEGIIVSREYYDLNDLKEEKPLSEFKAGQNYKGHITILAPQELNYVVVEERLPAGFEPIDMTLSTSSRAAALAAGEAPVSYETSGYWDDRFMNYDDVVAQQDYGMSWGFCHQEIRDDAVVWSDERVPAGLYHIRYPVRATTAGTYLMPGTTAFEFYEPEIFGRSRGREIKIKE